MQDEPLPVQYAAPIEPMGPEGQASRKVPYRARRLNVPNIVFMARLMEADWDDTLRAWRCPPLAIPGAIVEALYVEGSRIDSARYEVLKEQALIRWTPAD